MSRHEKVLVVDTEPKASSLLEALLSPNGEKCPDTIRTYDEAEKQIRKTTYDLVILDLDQNQEEAFKLLSRIKQVCQQTMVITTSRSASVQSVIDSMRKGAYDYITKPFKTEEFLLIIEKALENKKLGETRKRTEERLKKERMININLQRDIWKAMTGEAEERQSTILKPIQDLLLDIAQADSPVLIRGEVGTGKGLVARFIHYNSLRRDQPFMEINCAIYTEPILFTELFGYEKGAYTGALKTGLGRLELSNRGTIFLDDIDRLSEKIQYMLCRFLEDGKFYKMGGEAPVRTNVRVIGGTEAALDEEASTGKFREDLFYKLNLIPIHLPPLRDRSEDIPLIAMELLTKIQKKYRREKTIRGFSNKAVQAMASYPWPGNIREMENFIERAILTMKGQTIQLTDLPVKIQEGYENDAGTIPSLYESERMIIMNALKRCHGNKKHAARMLQINRSSLYSKIKRFQLTEFM
jgi:DNA-binding NtrC family response regulator